VLLVDLGAGTLRADDVHDDRTVSMPAGPGLRKLARRGAKEYVEKFRRPRPLRVSSCDHVGSVGLPLAAALTTASIVACRSLSAYVYKHAARAKRRCMLSQGYIGGAQAAVRQQLSRG